MYGNGAKIIMIVVCNIFMTENMYFDTYIFKYIIQSLNRLVKKRTIADALSVKRDLI